MNKFTEILTQLEEQKTSRAETWNRIKADAPDIAEFLTEINATFGKPAAVHVTINNKIILKRGEICHTQSTGTQ